ncbi:MAG: short chain dehydrogenase [Deltaproteobacteria bacterium]|nr:MAG: short chain dehydrogenase [Deltaproteobacteria bacterium]
MGKRFDGKVVWITGGGSGIGRALALELARQGADVAVSGRRQERIDEVAREICALGRRGIAVPCDVTDEDDIAQAVARVVNELGALDVAVANAGFSISGRIADITADQWRRQLDVNVVGSALTAKHALPHLEKTKGRIVLIGSIAAFLGLPKSGAYAASKWAVRALGQTLNIELAGSGVSCTTIHPGFVESEIAQVDNEGVYNGKRRDRRPQKFMWTADAAARTMASAIHRRKREHVFTNHGKLGAFMGQHFPGMALMTIGRSTRRPKALKP